MFLTRLCITLLMLLASTAAGAADEANHEVQDFGIDMLPMPPSDPTSKAADSALYVNTTSPHYNDAAISPASTQTSAAWTGHWNASTSDSTSCGCTVNAAAGLVWWYPEGLLNVLGRVTAIIQNATSSFSFQPFTSKFDAQEAIRTAGASISYVESWDAAHNTSTYYTIAFPGPTPTASLTVFTSVSDIRGPLPTKVFGVDVLTKLFRTSPPVPTFVVPVVGGPQALLTATPFDNLLYLTQIEVTYKDHTDTIKHFTPTGCPAAMTRALDRAIAIPFDAEVDLRTIATPSGTLNDKLSNYLPSFTQCAMGIWYAPSPTMVVIVEITVEKDQDVDILVHQEQTATSLDGPKPPVTDETSNATPLLQQETLYTTTHLAEIHTSDQPGMTLHLILPQETPIAVKGPAGPALGISDQVIMPAESVVGFIIDGSTLDSGQVVTVYGSDIVSIDKRPTPSIAEINGSTQTLASITQPPAIYVSGTPVAEQPDGGFSIASQTLMPGSSVVVAGTIISLGHGPRPSIIVINGATSSLSSVTLAVLSLSGSTYTATALPAPYVIDGQTLRPAGTPITFLGSTISLQPGGSIIVVNGHTSTMGFVKSEGQTVARASTIPINATSAQIPVKQTNSSAGMPLSATHAILFISTLAFATLLVI